MASLFRHSLHAPITRNPKHLAFFKRAFAKAVAARAKALSPAPAPGVAPPPVPDSVSISMLTASASTNFDSYLFVRFRGSTKLVQVLADSGNTSLIMPSLADLQALPNFATDYAILPGAGINDGIKEPWGMAAVLVRGPIEIPSRDGSIVTIPNCVFYACQGSNSDATANFGLGIVRPWQQVASTTVQSPLTYSPDYRYVEIDLADLGQENGTDPAVSEASLLTLSKTAPAGYRMLNIAKGDWMAVTPESLTIDGAATTWPGAIDQPIAMIDTGGTQPYLSDPNGDLYTNNALYTGTIPGWVNGPDTPADEQSQACIASKAPIGITLGDGRSTYSYTIDLSALPASEGATSLVICENCGYMQGANGMNIGGLSMLFNSLLIDQTGYQIGFKQKPAAGG